MNTSDASRHLADTHGLKFDYLPVGLFGSVMGLTGLSVVWKGMHSVFGAPAWVAQLCAALAVVAFVLITAAYALKLVSSFGKVLEELRHPVKVNMFATFWVSLLLLPLVVAPYSLLIARVLWIVGAIGMTILAFYIIDRWLTKSHTLSQVSPAWNLPVVGLLDLPLAVPHLSLPQGELLMLAGTAIGLFFAVPMFTIIFSRLIFEPPLPDALQPTMMIMVAPFAVGMSVYVATTGHADMFAKSLFALTLFLLVVLFGRLRFLPYCCPFRFAWWALSFPLAASAIAAVKFFEIQGGWLAEGIAVALVAASTVVIVWLLGRTLIGVLRGEMKTLSA